MRDANGQALDPYERNPLIFEDRRRASADSAWVRRFACEDVRPLIVCRGPIRKEAMDVFAQMGITHYGILLSEKDSIVYTYALAPELRRLDNAHVHRIKDYTGASKDERVERIREIIAIAKRHGYDSVFAGYGFMAEDEEFIAAIETAGLRFIGPGSHVARAAGLKDEAKRTAVDNDVSVTPGINNVTARLLLSKYPTASALAACAREHELTLPPRAFEGADDRLDELADDVLAAAYARHIDLYTLEELCAQIETEVAAMLANYPGSRVRLKAIGGGGGKGQRILDGAAAAGPGTLEERARRAASVAGDKAREILSEVKATGVGDNKNILIELNIEQTRHNEIQLIGNGEWALSMGGRDCSLQMHEQKLLEVSITQEGLEAASAAERAAGRAAQAEAIDRDRKILARMEEEAERFGRAVGLDSASTFECIVDRERHFFMEVNTRIQVEHRVSELCYTLRFRNPDAPGDFFDVNSLVECMVLLARHGKALPRPERIVRKHAAVEARLNATDRALKPHAGGIIVSWTDAIEDEIRDDQGISVKNPDTGMAIRYRLAGAYDSNIALLVTHGDSRADSYERLAEILRITRIRGIDLATNLEFHYGLVHFFLAQDVMAKATTRFVVPYLTLVGLLKQEADEVALDSAYAQIAARYEARAAGDKAAAAATRDVLFRKRTLVQRVVDRLFGEPHFLSAWLSRNRERVVCTGDRIEWRANPIEVMRDTYWLLNMHYDPALPAAQVIWEADHALLERALGFYRRLDERLGGLDWPATATALASATPPRGLDAPTWTRIQQAHLGFQAGTELLGLVPSIGHKIGFHELRVEDDLTITIPERLLDPALQKRMSKVLVPPPATKAGEIVAETGGMFYRQEAPGRPPLAAVGNHFDEGQPIYVIEVMKMFNKVAAPFAGTIDEILVDTDGTIVRKGQPLFRVTPDERFVEEDAAERTKRIEANTRAHVRCILGG
jgi:acetyl/propionyl-CoA carboxylase alpha subunit